MDRKLENRYLVVLQVVMSTDPGPLDLSIELFKAKPVFGAKMKRICKSPEYRMSLVTFHVD